MCRSPSSPPARSTCWRSSSASRSTRPTPAAWRRAGHVIDVDLGLAGDRYFALMAGAGVDAAVVSSLNPTLKRALREAAFAIQGFAKYLTERLAADPHRDRRGMRRRLLRRARQRRQLRRQLRRDAAGRHARRPARRLRAHRQVVLRVRRLLAGGAAVSAPCSTPRCATSAPRRRASRSPPARPGEVLVQTDGEPAGRLPIDCRIVPGALRVIVP